jgi:KTSC domain
MTGMKFSLLFCMGHYYLGTPGSGTTSYIKYRTERKILEIGFRSQEVYDYFKVPLHLWESYYKEVSGGGSSGKFFNEHIKDKFEFSKH